MGWQRAVKVIYDRQALSHIESEGRILADLEHPNIVRIHELHLQADPPYAVFEYVEGTDLRQRLNDGALEWKEAVRIIADVLAALQYAHERGVVHRDIKPSNILLSHEGVVKLSDFGVGQAAHHHTLQRSRTSGAPPHQQQLVNSRGSAERTSSGPGTPFYMSPQQLQNEKGDPVDDIYSVGVVLYELITGVVPVGKYQPASRAAHGAPEMIDEIIDRGLSPAREDRYASAEDMRQALLDIVLDWVECPECRKERREDAEDQFTCERCGRNHLCMEHRDTDTGFCQTCHERQEHERRQQQAERLTERAEKTESLEARLALLEEVQKLWPDSNLINDTLSETKRKVTQGAPKTSLAQHRVTCSHACSFQLSREHVWDMDLSGDGSMLVCALGDRVVAWDLPSGEVIFEIASGGWYHWSVAFDSEGRNLAVGGLRWRLGLVRVGCLKLCDPNTGECTCSLGGHRDTVKSLSFAHDSELLAAVDEHNEVKMWQEMDGDWRCLRVLNAMGDDWVSFSSDDNLLLSGYRGASLNIRRVENGESVATFKRCSAAAFGPGAATVAVCQSSGRGGRLGLYELPSREVWSVTLPSEACSTAFSHDGTTLATGMCSGSVLFWRVDDGTYLGALDDHDESVRHVAFDSAGKWFASGDWDGKIVVYDACEAIDAAKEGVICPECGRHHTSIDVETEFTCVNCSRRHLCNDHRAGHTQLCTECARSGWPSVRTRIHGIVSAGRYQRATALVENYHDSGGGDEVSLDYTKALISHSQGKISEAIRHYDAALEASRPGQRKYILLNRGLARHKSGARRQGLEDMKSAGDPTIDKEVEEVVKKTRVADLQRFWLFATTAICYTTGLINGGYWFGLRLSDVATPDKSIEKFMVHWLAIVLAAGLFALWYLACGSQNEWWQGLFGWVAPGVPLGALVILGTAWHQGWLSWDIGVLVMGPVVLWCIIWGTTESLFFDQVFRYGGQPVMKEE